MFAGIGSAASRLADVADNLPPRVRGRIMEDARAIDSHCAVLHDGQLLEVKNAQRPLARDRRTRGLCPPDIRWIDPPDDNATRAPYPQHYQIPQLIDDAPASTATDRQSRVASRVAAATPHFSVRRL